MDANAPVSEMCRSMQSERQTSKTFSIIVANYNRADTLKRCIDSALGQERASYEVIVVDGGSKDRSLDILREYGEHVRWRSEPDRGIAHAWNKGIASAKGEWLYFLG